MTRWDKDYADKSPEQNVAWLVNDIRTQVFGRVEKASACSYSVVTTWQVAKSSERPLFLSAMALSWAYNPAQVSFEMEHILR